MDINEKYFVGFEHRIIDTGEVKIHAWCGGTGHEAVLLLHGHPESHLTWYAVAPRLAERYRVVIPDMRGYGESSKPHGLPDHSTYSKRAMARDQVFVMDDGKVVMAGTPREIFSRAEELEQHGLTVPQITKLACELKREGLELPDGVLNRKELVEALCQLGLKR